MTNEDFYQKSATNSGNALLDDLYKLAQNDAIVHRHLTAWQKGQITLKQALAACVFELSTQLSSTREQLTDCIAESQRITGTDAKE